MTTPTLALLPSSTRLSHDSAKHVVKDILVEHAKLAPKPGDDVVLVPLGTGSAVPSRYRNGTNVECIIL